MLPSDRFAGSCLSGRPSKNREERREIRLDQEIFLQEKLLYKPKGEKHVAKKQTAYDFTKAKLDSNTSTIKADILGLCNHNSYTSLSYIFKGKKAECLLTSFQKIEHLLFYNY